MNWKLLLVSIFMLEFSASGLHAQTWTRTTAGTFSWSDGTNWAGGFPPNSAGVLASFTTLGGPATQTVNLTAGVTLGGINLSNSSTSYTFTGSAFTFNNGASAATINLGSGSLAQTINVNIGMAVTHTGGLTITNQGTGLLTLGGTLTLDQNQLIVNGSQAVTISGNIDYASQTALVNNSSGLLTVGNVNNSGFYAVAFGGSGNILATGALTGSGTIQQQGTGTVTLSSGIVNTNTLAFAADAGVMIMNGNITGSGVVSKTGSGTLTLNGLNNYTGPTTISGGQVNLNTASAIGTGPLTISLATSIDNTSGLTIALSRSSGTNVNTISADLTFIGSNPLSMGTESYGIGSGVRTITTNASTLTFASLTGAAGLTKAGAGTLVLGSAANSGANIVQGGTMTVTGAFGSGALTITNSNAGAGNSVILNLNGPTYSVGVLSSTISAPSLGTNTAILNLGSGTSFTTNIGSGTTTFVGSITGGGSVIKNGVGNWVLSGNSTYTGTTSIISGQLTLSAAAIAAGSGTVPTNFLPATTNLTLANGSMMTVQGMSSGSTNVSQTIAGLTVSAGVSTITLNAGTSTNVTFNLGTISHLAGGILVMNTSDSQLTVIGKGNANFAGGQQTILGGYLVANNNWVQAGSGAASGSILQYAGYTSSYSSTKDVDSPIGSSTVAGGFSVNSIRWNTTGGGTFHLNNSGTTTIATGGLFVTSAETTSAVNINGGQITSGNGQDLIVQQYGSQSLIINSVISGSIGLTKAGTGTLALTATNTYTGATFLLGGTTAVPSLGSTTIAGALGAAGSSSVLIAGSTLQYTGVGQSTDRVIRIGTGTATIENIGTGSLTLTDAGTITSGAALGTRTLALTGSYRGVNSLASAITDNGGITSLTINSSLPADQPNVSAMTSAWKLAGSNSFTGTVTISAGHLVLSNANALGTLTKTVTIANPTGNSAIRFDPGASGSITMPSMAYSVLSTSPTFYADTGTNIVAGSVNMAAGTGGLVATVAAGATLRFNATIGSANTGKFITLYGDGDGTFASSITGTTAANKLFSLTKAGGLGTWTLSTFNANTYSGPTVLVQGGLRLDYSLATVTPSAILSPTSTLVLQGGTFTMRGKSATDNVMALPALAFTGGASQFTFDQNSANSLTAGLGMLGRGSGGLVQFTIPASPGFILIGSANPGATNAILAYGSGLTPYGTVGTNDWAARDSSNHLVGLTSIVGGYTPSTPVLLTGNADVGSDTTLAVSTVLQSLRVNVAGARTINLGTNTLTAPGILITPAVGANTTTISNGTLTGVPSPTAVTATGGTSTINNSTLSFAALGSAPAIGSLVTGPGVFPNTVVTASTTTTVTLSTPAASTTSGSTFTFARSEDLTIVQNNTSGGLTINATIANNVTATNLAKHGDGLLTLGAANSYTGSTIIAGGTVRIATTNALPASTMLTINDVASATLDLNNLNQTVAGLSGGGTVGGKVTLGTGTLTLSDASNTSTTWKGVISGTGGLAKNVGSGTLFIQNNNTYTGPTTINAGTVVVGNADNVGSLGTGDITIGSGATLAYQRADTVTVANNIGGAGNLALIIPAAGTPGSGEGGLTILTGNNTYTGSTTINVSTNGIKRLQIGNGGTSGTLGTGNIVNNGQLIANRSDTLTFQGPITGTGSITNAGTGVLILNSANSYTGSTIVNRGTIRQGTNNAIPGGSAIVINSTTTGTATLDLNGFNMNAASLTFSGAAVSGGNAGAAMLSLGSGTLTLDGDVRYDSSNSPAGATITGTTGRINLSSTRMLAVDASPNAFGLDLSIQVLIAGSFGITKTSAGTVLLGTANTYSGGTNIIDGRVIVNNTFGSGTGSGPVTVGGGGTIGGSGFIVPNTGSTATNTVTVHGKIAPGNSPGTLTIGSASTNATALIDGTYAFELSSVGSPAGYGTGNSTVGGAVHDVIVVNGSLNIAGSHITITSLGSTGFNPAQSYSWTIATATGGITGSPPTIDSISGTDFAAANSSNFILTSNGNNLTLNYSTTPIPEPLGLLALASGLFLAGRRLRR